MYMQRKYVYLVVSLLIIAVVLFQAQENSSVYLNNDSINEVKLTDDYLSIEEETKFTINNYQNDDNVIEYTYELTVDGVSGAYEYSKGDKTNYLVFTANGYATFTLKSNESIVINDLPKDKSYTLVQKNQYDNYTITINDEIKNQTSGITGISTEVTIKNSTSTPTPKEKKKEQETDKKSEEKKEQQKDKGPNTAVISSVVVIGVIVSLIIGYLLTKIKIKRFE